MDQRPYESFSRSIHNFYADQRVPLDVAIEVTYRCPLACVHCYNNLPLGDADARGRELSKEEHFSLLDQLADLGCVWLLFTGGEIFARPDFLEIYAYAKSKGFLITLFTNAILITDEIADFLAEQPPFLIEITIYGRSKQAYEAMTGRPGTYERCFQAIDRLKTRNLPLRLKSIATSINSGEVPAMRQFAEDQACADFRFDSLVNARIDCSNAPLAVRLSPEQVVALDVQSAGVMSEYAQLLGADRIRNHPATGTVYRCGGGMKSFAVDPYGGMSLCVLSKRDVYDIRSGSVREGWADFLKTVRGRQATKPSRCDMCSIESVCGMCPAHAELENGDAETPIEFLCEVAHLRALVLGIEPAKHGDCPFCSSGERYPDLVSTAQRLQGSLSADSHSEGYLRSDSTTRLCSSCTDCSRSKNGSTE